MKCSQTPSFWNTGFSLHAEEHADADDAEQPHGDQGSQGGIRVRSVFGGRRGRRGLVARVEAVRKVALGCDIDVAGDQ